MEVLAVDLGCKVGELPTTYLGLPVSKSNINLGLCERNILQKTINAEKVIYFEWGEVNLDTKYVVLFACIFYVIIQHAQRG